MGKREKILDVGILDFGLMPYSRGYQEKRLLVGRRVRVQRVPGKLLMIDFGLIIEK